MHEAADLRFNVSKKINRGNTHFRWSPPKGKRAIVKRCTNMHSVSFYYFCLKCVPVVFVVQVYPIEFDLLSKIIEIVDRPQML